MKCSLQRHQDVSQYYLCKDWTLWWKSLYQIVPVITVDEDILRTQKQTTRLGEVKGLIWLEQVDGKSDSCGLDRLLSWEGWSRNIGLLSWNAWSVWQGRSRGWRRLGGRGAGGREVVRHRAGEGRWWSLEESKDKNTKVMCTSGKTHKQIHT